MRAVLSPVALLYILASLLLVQVLATPKITSDATQSKSIQSREPVQRGGSQIIQDSLLNLMVRVVSGTTTTGGAQASVVDTRAAGHIADAAVKSHPRMQADLGGNLLADRNQASTMLLEREDVTAAAEGQNAELGRTSLVLRSAAPKVFGINIYLIIAWLVFMYLMYRTGSL